MSAYACPYCGLNIEDFRLLRRVGFAGGRWGGKRQWVAVEVRACSDCEGHLAREVALPFVVLGEDATAEREVDLRRAYAGCDHDFEGEGGTR
jgi:hypothetical protein